MKILALAAPDRVTGRITENGNRVGDFTVDGTIELVIFAGVLAGGVGAIIYLISEPWLRWTRWTRWAGGGAFALLLLATGSRAALDPDNSDFLIVTHEPLAVGLLASLFMIFGVLLPPCVGALDRVLPKPDGPRPLRAAAPYLIVVGSGSLFVPVTLIALFEEFPASSVFVATMGIATATVWWSRCAGGDPPFALAVRGVGYLSLAGAVVAGAVHVAHDLTDIL